MKGKKEKEKKEKLDLFRCFILLFLNVKHGFHFLLSRTGGINKKKRFLDERLPLDIM